MSAKAIKKYGEEGVKVSVSSLMPFDKDGWLTKQGGSFKSWKRRYFVLKAGVIYYYKTEKDTVITGRIDLTSASSVKEDSTKGKKYLFAVTTSKRTFYVQAEKQEDLQGWITAIEKSVHSLKGGSSAGGGAPHSSTIINTNSSSPEVQTSRSIYPETLPGDATPRKRLDFAKKAVSFLQEPDSKVLEFWTIWAESIPDLPSKAEPPGMAVEFWIATSADMQKVTWRTSGPQNIFIQKMVDFFECGSS